MKSTRLYVVSDEARQHIYPEHRYGYEHELNRLEKAPICVRNKELIKQWHAYLFSNAISKPRVQKLSSQLRRICQMLGKDLDSVYKEDIELLLNKINNVEAWTLETRRDYTRCVRQFFRYFEDEDPRQKEVNLRSTNSSLRDAALDRQERLQALYKRIKKLRVPESVNSIDKGSIITDEDVLIVIEKGCRSVKERALLRFLHETGARASELLSMKLKNLKFEKTHCLVELNGKTGQRFVPVVHSVKYLRAWMEIHPHRGVSESFLWLVETNSARNKPLCHQACVQLVNRCFVRAGLGHRKHNLHWFRHSRATLLAPHMTEPMLRRFMGWEAGSDMVRVYVHTSVKDLEDIYLGVHGLRQEDNKIEYKPRKCVCGEVNPSEGRYCFRCGQPLGVDVVVQDEALMRSEMDKSIKLLLEVAQNPELMRQFEQFKKGLSNK